MLPQKSNELPCSSNKRLIPLSSELIRDMLEHDYESHSEYYSAMTSSFVGDAMPSFLERNSRMVAGSSEKVKLSQSKSANGSFSKISDRNDGDNARIEEAKTSSKISTGQGQNETIEKVISSTARRRSKSAPASEELNDNMPSTSNAVNTTIAKSDNDETRTEAPAKEFCNLEKRQQLKLLMLSKIAADRKNAKKKNLKKSRALSTDPTRPKEATQIAKELHHMFDEDPIKNPEYRSYTTKTLETMSMGKDFNYEARKTRTFQKRLESIQHGIGSVQNLVPNTDEKRDRFIKQKKQRSIRFIPNRNPEMLDIFSEDEKGPIYANVKNDPYPEDAIINSLDTILLDEQNSQQYFGRGHDNFLRKRQHACNVLGIPRSATSFAINQKLAFSSAPQNTNACYKPTKDDKKRDNEAAAYLMGRSKYGDQ